MKISKLFGFTVVAVSLLSSAPAFAATNPNLGQASSFTVLSGTFTNTTPGTTLSGDLGYTYGNYEFRSKDKEGKATVERGKYVSIWKKQKNGNWKVVMDMGNSSPNPK